MNSGLIVALTLVGVAALILILKSAPILRLRFARRQHRDPVSKGAPVQGTAQILSSPAPRPTTDLDIVKVKCRIELRVQLPGQPPYDATTYQLVNTDMLPFLPGSTVVVTADSANPQDVCIDFAQPLRWADSPGETEPA